MELSVVVGFPEVALFEKTFLIVKIKTMMYLQRFRLSLEGDKACFIVLITSVRIKCHVN